MTLLVLQVLLSSLHVWTVTAESKLTCSHQPIVALTGDDIVLPCSLDPPISASSQTVEWTRPDLDLKYIHVHRDRRLQHSSYENRTKLFVDELKNGNVSLKIFAVNVSDAGTYKCYLPLMQKQATIRLIVVESELICSQQPIVGLVGDDVILPCHLEPPISVIDETVVWSRPDVKPEYVHYHQDGRLMFKHQNSDYFLRTRLFMDGLTNGNVSMKIFRVKLSDAGTYSCSLPSMKKEASIQLIVRELEVICSHEPVIATAGDDVILPCRLEPPFDVTTRIVEWKHSGTKVHLYHSENDVADQDENFISRTSLFQEELVRGNISLKLCKVTEQDEGNYTCFVSELDSQVRRGFITLIVGGGFDTYATVAMVGAAVAALVAALFAALVCNCRRHESHLNNKHLCTPENLQREMTWLTM